MRFCSCCVSDSQFCFVLKELDKCKYCVQSKNSYNLTIFLIELNCINKELQQLQKKKKELKIRKERLYK